MPSFGEKVAAEAARLRASGKDVNQIAGILCKADARARNYGIGIILDGAGKPAKTSPTLSALTARELKRSSPGNYMNSAPLLEKVKKAALAWQGVPAELAADFVLALPSDAGTGAVTSALQAALLLDPSVTTLGFEQASWPAYRTIAAVLGRATREVELGAVIQGRGVLPVYQAGPHNSTGRVPKLAEVRARAQAAQGTTLVLDRAYPGFEYASKLRAWGYAGVMRKSFEVQVEPFLKAKTPLFLAVSPTKAFVTFALRPCGLLLAYAPDAERRAAMSGALNQVMRARGSAFEHPATRAFAQALVEKRSALQREHGQALRRLAQAEAGWRKLVDGTPLAPYFSEDYAGLFRNVPVKDGADAALYAAHLYPVLSPGRCRLNVSGLPANAARAKQEAAAFAAQVTA